MATERIIEIKADTTDAIASVENLAEVVKKTEAEIREEKRKTDQADREARNAQEKALREVDKLTGGYLGKVKDLASSVKALPTAFSAFSKGASAAFGAAIKGAGGLQKALIATGIGALVVALGLIVAYWDDILGLVNGVSVAQKQQLAAAEANVSAQEAATEQLGLQENTLRLQGKSEKEIRDLKIEQTNETITALEAQIESQEQIKKSQIDAANRNKQILQGIIRFLTLPLTTLLGTIDMIGKRLGQDFGLEEGFSGGIAKLVFDPEEVSKEADAAIVETKKKLAKMKSTRDGYLLTEKKENQDAAKTKADAQKKLDDDELKRLEALNQAKLDSEENFRKQQQDLADKYDELVLAKLVSKEDQEKNEVLDKFFAMEQMYANNAEALALITTQRNKEIKEIDDKYRQEEKDADKKSNEEKLAARQEIGDIILDSANSLFQNLLSLNEFYDKDDESAAKKAFERAKSIQIAQTIVNTAAGIMAALATPNVGDQITGANWAKAAALAATGAVQIATISKTQYKSAAKSSAGGSIKEPNAPTSMTPSFNIVGSSGTNQLAESISGMLSSPLRAYVVSGEVSSAQSMERNRIKTATFG
jgi:cytochrome c biogenesis protein CcdA